MAKYLSRRVPVTPQSRLPDFRYQYLKLADAEPNLGQPPGDGNIPVGEQYVPIAIAGYSQRYWIPVPPAIFSQGITVRDEGNVVGVANSITQLNFVGPGVSVAGTVTSGIGIATITISNPIVREPDDSEPRFIGFTSIRENGVLDYFDIDPTALVYYPNSQNLGIGITQPLYRLDLSLIHI